MRAVLTIEKYLDRVILTFFVLLFVLLTAVGTYVMADTVYIYSGASQHGTLVYKPGAKKVEQEDLHELSRDCVGWLTIDGTTIDYPVMQGRTNASYLNTNPFGEYSLSGSIFLDCSNSPDFTDSYSLLYGHHMEGGAMFGALDKFLDEDYFMRHRTGTLTLTDGTVYHLKNFAVLTCTAGDTEIFCVGEGGPDDGYLSGHALYSLGYESNKILAMTTCLGDKAEDRMAVLAEMIQ